MRTTTTGLKAVAWGAAPSEAPPGRWFTPGLAAPEEQISDLPSSLGFIGLQAAFRATGGTARADDLARLLEYRRSADGATLPELMAEGAVFGFRWRHCLWIPMFQFDLADLSIKRGPHAVLEELSNDFDGWTRAAWFARPTAWLQGRRPVDLLESNLNAVLGAARADRFIAAG
ncbi:hypothetical protein [Roseateles toxinivorans]|uniref:Uncharacterized protein n=1 Tax=Roseateles toxinivorans TaxID=270368 RepID=A0A4R6QNE2_9BURK|nr:hypothetical protein [Roseateles toxinivorans]TDP71078.1 hypothetical protein DES47_10356 [Roseateles toxinivorans]